MLLKHARCAHLGEGVSGITPDHRAKRKLEIGVDVPTNDEIKRLFNAAAASIATCVQSFRQAQKVRRGCLERANFGGDLAACRQGA
jgi:hypothetical protein